MSPTKRSPPTTRSRRGSSRCSLERNRVRAEARGVPAEVVEHELLTADAMTMLAVLERLRSDHGSVEGYLESHGLPADAVPSLRTGLLA